jgi:thiamine kinase-like enzyme
VRRTGLFAAGLLDAHVERLELLREAYDAGSIRLISSHNAPTPGNILFDGERLWLVDWESAFRNDPLVDAAIVLDHFARSQELEDVLLKAWLAARLTRGCVPGSRRSVRSPACITRASCSARLPRRRG